MRVTRDMTTEGGGRMDKLADFLGTDEKTGIQVTMEDGEVVIVIDSTSFPNEKIRLDPSTGNAVAALIRQRSAEAAEALR